MKKKWLYLLCAVVMVALLTVTALGTQRTDHVDNTIRLSYDDRKDLSELLNIAVESVSISNQVVTSNAVGTQTKDENVLVYENGTLYAVGTGSATLTVNGQDYEIAVSAAPISLFMITGHSVGMGQEGNAAESVLCEAGQVYSTYGRGASIDNTAGGLGWGSAIRADAELDAFAPGGGGNIGEGSGLAYEWNRISGEKVWVMNVALGGSCLNEWLPDALNHNPTYGKTSHFNNAVSVFRSAQTVVAAEIAAGHYTLGNMAVIYHTGANFSWYSDWSYEGFQADYDAMWSGYREQLSMDMDGDGEAETVQAMGFVPYWDVNDGKNYVLDKPAGYYMSASDEYPGIFTVSQVYRTWLTDGDVQKNFPEIDYATQSGVVLQKPVSTLHTNKGGSSDNSVYCSKDYAHLNQVAYNAVGQDIAKNLYSYFRVGHEVKSLTFCETPTGVAVTQMQMSFGESVRLTCATDPFYAEGVTFTVTDNLKLSYPLCITATGTGNGALYAYRGDTLLAQVDVQIISTHSHCVCGGLADHGCETEAWMPWGDTDGEKATLPTESGNYYLVSDILLTTTASIENQDIKLCLNGHKVESAVKVFWVGSNSYTGGSLTLTDCKDSGTVTVTAVDSNGGGLLRMRPNADSLNIYGGIYDATGLTEAAANGGLFYLTGGTTNIYGGTFKGGLLKDAGKHGSIGYVTGTSQVNVFGGTFLGGNCSKGGIFEMDSANVTVTISDGTFTGGNATYGDLFNVANAATLNISGGSFTHKENNPDTLRSFSGGIINLTGGSFDSLKLVNGANSAYTDILGILGEGAYYTVDGTPVVPEAGTLSLTGSVTVVSHTDHCVCTGNLEHSCDSLAWEAWTSATALPTTAGNYYLATDVTLSGAWDWNNKQIRLCLNGHTVTGASGKQTVMLGKASNTDSSCVTKLSVSDCKGTGVIQSASNIQGPVLRIRADLYAQVDFYSGTLKGIQQDHTQNGGTVSVTGGIMNMYGGTVYGADGDSTKTNIGGGAVYLTGMGSFNLHGGTIHGGKEYYRGGAVLVDSADAVFTMYGGTVQGGQATHGNAMANAGNVYIYGGTIDCDLTTGTTLQIRQSGAYHITACSFLKGVRTQNCTLLQALGAGHYADQQGQRLTPEAEQTGIFTPVQVLPHENHCVCGGLEGHSCEPVQSWTVWTDATSLPTVSGYYCLGTDVTLSQPVSYGGSLEITLCLNGHTVTGSEQGMLWLGDSARLTLTDCGKIGTLQAVGTVESGGVLYMNGGTADIYGGTLRGCQATHGGTVMVDHSSAVLNIYGGTLTGGTAGTHGGNIANKGQLYISGEAVIENGTAGSQGGNIFCFAAGRLHMTGGKLMSGKAGSGGNLFCNSDQKAELTNVIFENGETTSARGGNLQVPQGKTVVLTDCVLIGGSARNSEGGSIYVAGSLTVADCTVTADTAYETAATGGAICSVGTLVLENTTVSGGRASSGIGGSIAICGGTAQITGCTINSGFAGSGAGLCLDGGKLTVADTVITDRDAMASFCVRAGQLTLAGDTQLSVKLLADVTGLAVSGKALLDLNGFTVTDAVVSGELQLIDSQTDDYEGSFGSFSGAVAATVEQLSRADDKTYLTVNTDGVYSAHRYYVGITAMSLQPTQAAFGYRAVFCGDETVRGLVTNYGFQLWLEGCTPKTYTKSGSFATGDSLTLRLKNILSAGNDSLNAIGSTATICGQALATVELDGKTLTLSGIEHQKTLREMVEAVNANASSYSESQITAMQSLCNTFDTWMQGWETANILNWSGQQTQEHLLQVGFGRVDITPTESVPLSGYGNTSTRMSNNVLSKLYSTCIAFTDARGETVLLFHNDLMTTYSDIFLQLCQTVSEATGVPVTNIHVAATHTHSGPDLSNTAEESILRYRQQLIPAIVQAAVDAMADRKAANMSIGAVNCPDLNFIRHYLLSDGSYVGSNFGDATGKTIVDYACQVDDQMQLIRFARESGKDVVLMNWQTHPSRTGGGTKYDLSSDVVGVIRDSVEAQADCLFAYFTGASGNINPTSRIVQDNITADYLTQGQALAQYALTTLSAGMRKAETGDIQTCTNLYTGTVNHSEDHLVEIARSYYQHWTTEHEWDSVAAEALTYGINSGYHAGQIINRSKLTQTRDLVLSAFSIGDVAFTVSPYEMFSQNGSNIKNGSPFKMTFVVTCADGNEGYMPTREAFAYNCYESNVCKFTSGIAEALEAQYLTMLQNLFAKR